MKIVIMLLRPLSRQALLAAFLLSVFCVSSFAQSGAIPVVTVRATDPFASWAGDPGAFTLFRDGPTNATLNVFYRLDRTASNALDFAQIPYSTSIPARE